MYQRTVARIAHARAIAVAATAAVALGGGLAMPAAAAAVPAPLVARTAAPAWPAALGESGFVAVTCAGVPKTTPCITKGAVVTEAQRRLIARKYTTFGVKVTGVFDAATGRAIQKFKADQAARGNDIGTTPRIGIRTYQALLTAPVSTPARPRPTSPPKSGGASADCTPVRGRTCKADTLTPVSFHGRSIRAFCPVVNATVGDKWGAGRGHQGVDLLITNAQHQANTPIYAVEDGVIIKSWRQGNGALVVQQRGESGAGYYYGHQKANLVSKGDTVKAGDIIGYVGDTGSPGAPHLHFEVHPVVYSGKYLRTPADAWPFIRAVCF